MIASVGEVAMFFAISDFTAVNRAALFAAGVAVGAAVRSGDGGIWGVSDPLCHPPVEVLRLKKGVAHAPKSMSHSSGEAAPCCDNRRVPPRLNSGARHVLVRHQRV